MSSRAHADKKKKDILILGRGPTQGLGEHSLTSEKMYLINFTKHYRKVHLSLHYNGKNSYLLANRTEIHKFKASDSEIVSCILCLGNCSKAFLANKMIKTGLNQLILFMISVLTTMLLQLVIYRILRSI